MRKTVIKGAILVVAIVLVVSGALYYRRLSQVNANKSVVETSDFIFYYLDGQTGGEQSDDERICRKTNTVKYRVKSKNQTPFDWQKLRFEIAGIAVEQSVYYQGKVLIDPQVIEQKTFTIEVIATYQLPEEILSSFEEEGTSYHIKRWYGEDSINQVFKEKSKHIEQDGCATILLDKER